MNDHEIDRKFLHDMATPLTVLKATIQRLLKEVKGEQQASPVADTQKRLEKAMSALDSILIMHADHKARIHTRESNVTKKAG